MVNGFMKTYNIPETLVLSIAPVTVICGSNRVTPSLSVPDPSDPGTGGDAV